MTSVLMAAAGIVALVAAPLGVRWLVHWRHQENHAQHAAGAMVVEQPRDQDFYGSMTLAGEREIQAAQDQQFGTHFMLHGPAHRDPVCFWCGTEELERRVEDDRDGDQTAAWFRGLGEDPGPGVVAPSHGPPPGPAHCPRCGVAHKEPHCADGREWGPWPPVDAARPWLDVQLEDLYVWVREVLAA